MDNESLDPTVPAGYALRAMEAHDVPAVLALWQACDGVGLSPGDEPQSLAAILARNAGLSVVAASAQGNVVGAVLVGHDARRGYLYHLAVDEAHRGVGIGRALVRQALEGLRAAGIPRCTIVVLGDNQKGAAFWRHLGWSTREDLKVMQMVP
jgi:ribosomal protein S18 acetylase RimI-like enzyme